MVRPDRTVPVAGCVGGRDPVLRHQLNVPRALRLDCHRNQSRPHRLQLVEHSTSRARVARLLHELERRNWVQRRASASEGRSHSLFLTSAGEKALARIKSLAERHEAQTAEFVEPRRRMLLMGSVERFRPTHRVTTLGGTTAVIAVRDFRCWQMLSKRICGGSPEQH